jgi:hypothetical protein
MKPVDFPGANAIFGKEQPQYLPLPAMFFEHEPDNPDNKEATVITCWELDDADVEAILKNRRVYVSQYMPDGGPLQPQCATTDLSHLFE